MSSRYLLPHSPPQLKAEKEDLIQQLHTLRHQLEQSSRRPVGEQQHQWVVRRERREEHSRSPQELEEDNALLRQQVGTCLISLSPSALLMSTSFNLEALPTLSVCVCVLVCGAWFHCLLCGWCGRHSLLYSCFGPGTLKFKVVALLAASTTVSSLGGCWGGHSTHTHTAVMDDE